MSYVRRETRRVSRPLLPERGLPNCAQCGDGSRTVRCLAEEEYFDYRKFCGQSYGFYKLLLHVSSCSDCRLTLQHLHKQLLAACLGDPGQTGPNVKDCHAAVKQDVSGINPFPLSSDRETASKGMKIQIPTGGRILTSSPLPVRGCSGPENGSTDSLTTRSFSSFSSAAHSQPSSECSSSPDTLFSDPSDSPVDDTPVSPESVLRGICGGVEDELFSRRNDC
ncbi:MAG: hypothetical protein M1813_002961 [Trichoglossum hirsutum]|nr:MAG: hypothetical protein M1813_002961 [Trichoglossum hirsutum]